MIWVGVAERYCKEAYGDYEGNISWSILPGIIVAYYVIETGPTSLPVGSSYCSGNIRRAKFQVYVTSGLRVFFMYHQPSSSIYTSSESSGNLQTAIQVTPYES